MSKAQVCESCGGVALPEGVEEQMEQKNCATPGCQNEGKPLAQKDVNPDEDTMVCPTCGGRFMKDSGHSHE